MITAQKLIENLEDVMVMLKSNYTSAQWNAKNEVDMARYKEAKRVYEESVEAIDLEEVAWNNISEEEYEAIGTLIDNLQCEIEMMEENLDIE